MPKIVSQPLAPSELLNDLVCFCEDLCSDDCVCVTNEQPCTQEIAAHSVDHMFSLYFDYL